MHVRLRGVFSPLVFPSPHFRLRSFSVSSGNGTSGVVNNTTSFLSKASVYGELCKARLSSLVVITSGAGFMLAGHPVDWVALTAAVSGTALAAAAANTFNQISEAPLDALMKRTQGRPLPTGRLTRAEALTFGLGTTAASAAVLYAGTNSLTLALGMGNIALYAGVYTPLKQLTPLNTAVGAVVGRAHGAWAARPQRSPRRRDPSLATPSGGGPSSACRRLPAPVVYVPACCIFRSSTPGAAYLLRIRSGSSRKGSILSDCRRAAGAVLGCSSARGSWRITGARCASRIPSRPRKLIFPSTLPVLLTFSPNRLLPCRYRCSLRASGTAARST